MIITCTACGANAPYCIGDFLNDLSAESGIGQSEDREERIQKLELWGVVEKEDRLIMNEPLRWEYAVKTLERLLENGEDISGLLAVKEYRNR